MKFKKNTRRAPIVYERELIRYWKDNKIFEESVNMRPADNAYVFYDGPPFITGVPHHGTLLSSIVKDAVPRYWTMKGRRVERVWGWDCHGLPAEVYTERKLGIKGKRDIGTKVSLEKYILTCRENMVQTGSEWEDTIDRVGRWVDFKGAYKTMDKDYMESVWWAFKQLYERGKIYEGEKVLLYCTRDATPISKAEVAMDNSYQDVTDPSVFVKLKLTDSDTYLLVWTTTPWTLPANTAGAVNSKLTYAEVKLGSEKFILAKALLNKVLTDAKHQVLDFKILRTFKGSELVGRSYEPLFENHGKNAHKIWDADYVSTEEGSGAVHLAPAYGEEDFELAQKLDFPIVKNIDDNGFYTSGKWQGQYVWDANKEIAKELHEQGTIWKVEYITHAYPHCHRCGTKLMYRAHPSWFMNVTSQRTEMLEKNEPINWFPSHIKTGRWPKTIQSAPDWNLSRDRFWATAMPVWKGTDKQGKQHLKVIGSYAELKKLSGKELEDYHRPWIDDVTFEIDGVKYQRIDKVLDSWFESGSMPFAQFHYPFANQEKFENNFPGDFIAEYVGQVRAWFYYLHAMAIGLFDTHAFNNVIVTGTLAGNDGRKMSKSYNNYTDPNLLMDEYSADALRFLLLSSPLLNGDDFSLIDKDVADTARKLNMVWNMYDFFTLYAEVDGWQWDGSLDDPTPELNDVLDRWIISRIHQLTKEVDDAMQAYNLPLALAGILPFIDDASNWYLRRSRKRFWKTDNDSDKQLAYKALHYLLVRLSMIIAPFTPFMAEELYRNLTGGKSVHLLNWPASGHINELVLDEMAQVRGFISEGLAQRAAAGLKVRQPLQSVTLPKYPQIYSDMIKEELNVKEINTAKFNRVVLNTTITDKLKIEGLARELIRQIQNARKKAQLQVEDRINLNISSPNREVEQAIDSFKEQIMRETLAVNLNGDKKTEFKEKVNVNGAEATVALSKSE